ncbi:response regulator transcription factor [Actinomyces sp. zg-332]|uniref:MtrAB system response regulator MtrA n=1 Tax=Actinomyces sp. zg-332 TaxID=2708340 RepID=UPI00141F7C91|nr:MtrAB system response regulator MtrA [Actinomyces sp. zg-332]QPK94631.1 response regulator transcription factor [Actinomyces sp. zg-332]
MTHILLIESDETLTEMFSALLESVGYTTTLCNDGVTAMSVFNSTNPDLVILDVSLPGLSGLQICKKIRLISDIPIIIVSAKCSTDDIVTGLEAGADDYVIKPFKTKELLARIKTRLRTSDTVEESIMYVANMEIDTVAHQVKKHGEIIQLTPLEFLLFSTLASKPGKVFTREELLEIVWGYKHVADTRLVNVHVQRLRSKIEDDPENPKTIVTIRGIGYRCETRK